MKPVQKDVAHERAARGTNDNEPKKGIPGRHKKATSYAITDRTKNGQATQTVIGRGAVVKPGTKTSLTLRPTQKNQKRKNVGSTNTKMHELTRSGRVITLICDQGRRKKKTKRGLAGPSASQTGLLIIHRTECSEESKAR